MHRKESAIEGRGRGVETESDYYSEGYEGEYDFDNLKWPTLMLSFGPPPEPPPGYSLSVFDTTDKEQPGWIGEPKWSYLKKSDANLSMAWARSKEWPGNWECIGGWSGKRSKRPCRRSAKTRSGADRPWERCKPSSMKFWKPIAMPHAKHGTPPIASIPG